MGAEAESAKSGDESIATVEVSEGNVKITSAKAGETTITVSKSGYSDAKISVTVAEDGAVTASVSTKFAEIPADAVLSKIEVTESVEIEEYSTEDDLKSKITVSAFYDNGASSSVADYTLSGFDSAKIGEEQDVTVTYTEKEVEKTAEVKVTVKALFRSLNFDGAFDGTTDKDYASESADYVSEDGTWAILHGVDKSAAKVSKNAAKSYNEDESYTSRIQMKLEVLKLKVGKNKDVILRVDGGSASGSGENRTLTAKGSTTATWQSFKGSADGKVCAGFFSVKGDANGYVTLSADKNINIYGIKLVESAEDLSAVVLGNSVSYKDKKITLSATEVNQNESITAAASATKVTTPLYANGLAGEGSSEVLTTFNFYVDPKGDDTDTPVETLPTSEIGEHEVEAYLYTVAENGEKVENDNVCASTKYTVVDPNAVKYTVTFDAGEGSFAEGATTTFITVEENKTLDSNSIPKPTAPEGYRFKGWASSVDGLTTESGITGDVTFTATYEVKPAVQEYVLDVANATFEHISKTSGNPTTGDITINGVKFEISENKDKDLPDTQNSKKVINMGGKVSKEKNYIKFTTTGEATVKVTFFGSTADRHIKIISETDSTGQTGTEATTKDKKEYTTTFNLSDEGTYYLGGDNGLYITKVSVEM